ncbi:hypothetical protein GEV33_002689 [Tenebrio molitor]|uniref:Uncharacterized protein n=1 Tax=Tenebrio molitor TaxID=7067 RepID=A0A8J6LIH2_TENMO|nr:hypothetical protein GEV33_002689 [Tenebrio molitor]
MEDTTPSTSHMVEDRPRRAKQRRLDQQSTTSEDPVLGKAVAALDVLGQSNLNTRKCRTAGSSHRDARSVQLPGRLIAQRNKVQIFRVDLLDSRVAKKNPSRAEIRGTRSATAERAAGAASRELRITCVAFGIRNHPCGWIAERHGAYRPALPAFGAVEEPEDLPLPYRYRYRFAVVEKPLVV